MTNTNTARRAATLNKSGTHQFAKAHAWHLVTALVQIACFAVRDAFRKR